MKFSEMERRAKGRVRLHTAHGSAKFKEGASDFATQSLWLRKGKVGSQVSGKDRSQFPGRRTIREIRGGGRQERRASDIAKKRVYRFRVRPRRKRRASLLPCLSLGNDIRSTSGSGDISLAIFITSVNGSESFASFTTFHLSRPPGFRRAFDASERNGRSGRIQCQNGKESSSSGKRRVFLCRGTVLVKVGGKAIPVSFLKIEGREALVGAKDRKERDG